MRSEIRIVARIVVGGRLVLFAFTARYVAAFHAPRAKGFEVGVVGDPAPGAHGAEWVTVGRVWPFVITAVVIVPLLILAWWQVRRR